MNKKQLIVVGKEQALKTLISFDYTLGFLPVVVIYYITRFFSKPKTNVEEDKRLLYIQVIITPLIFALLISILWFYFNLNRTILSIILSAYHLLVIYVHYTEDPLVLSVTYGDIKDSKKLSKRLKTIKLILFWIFIFIFTLSFPFK